MAAVAQHHALGPVDHGVAPLLAVARDVFAPDAMAFHIAFVHHVKAHLVAQLIKIGIVRIMARADSVYVGLLHQRQIANVRLFGNGPSVVGIEIVSVDALEDHLLPVDIQNVSANLHALEADPDLFLAQEAFRTGRQDGQRIEVRCLGRPWQDVGHFVACPHGIAAEDLEILLIDRLSVEQDFARDRTANGMRIDDRGFDAQHAARAAAVEHSFGVNIVDTHDRLRHEINAAGDTGHIPHVLVFQIRAVAVAENACGDLVDAFAQKMRNIKLCRRHRAL